MPDPPPPPKETRGDVRSKLFVMGALVSPDGSGPVRIRNMSRGGALVEGGVIPPVGAAVQLNRGTLGAQGRIAWRSEGKAGIKFDGSVCVADWLPNGIGAKSQQRVDEAVFQYKSGGSHALPQAVPGSRPGELRDVDLADKLLKLKQRLQSAAEDLADGAETARQLLALQLIDNTTQDLEKMARQLVSRAAAKG